MNKTILIAFSAMILLTSGCGSKDSAENGVKKHPAFMFWCFRKEIVSSQYHVPDMATPAAATYIESVIRSVQGYESSSVDLTARTITISYYSSSARKMNFEEAIAFSGFSVNGRPANPAGEKRLPEGVK